MLRYRLLAIFIFCLITAQTSFAQELYVFNEPASNMPARSTGIRLSNWWMIAGNGTGQYQLQPEVMFGFNKQLMGHAELFVNGSHHWEMAGGGIYAKYRFYSKDAYHRHFRMAAFLRASYINEGYGAEELQVNGQNTGLQLGWIGTQLLHKTALSATINYTKALPQSTENAFITNDYSQAIDYHLSAGHLIYPKNYKGYKQTNINLMVEWQSQMLLSGKSYAEIAPSLQFIFNSQTRVDFGYKYQLYGNLARYSTRSLLFRIEHLIFR